jgi:hypothetical protein
MKKIVLALLLLLLPASGLCFETHGTVIGKAPTVLGYVYNALLSGAGWLVISPDEQYAYVCAYNVDTVLKIDIRDKYNPTILGYVTDPIKLDAPEGVDLRGDLLAVASGVQTANHYIYFADVSGVSPVFISSVQPVTSGAPWDVKFYGDVAWVVGQQGIMTIGVTTPSTPVRLFETTSWGGGSYALIDEENKILYYRSGGLTATGGVTAISISDPTNPVLIGSIHLGGDAGLAYSLAKKGNTLFAGGTIFNPSLFSIDVTNPSGMNLIQTVLTSPGPRTMAVAGNFLFTATGTTGGVRINVFDISDPSNMVLSDALVGRFSWDDIRIAGNYLYAACNGSFVVMKISTVGTVIRGGRIVEGRFLP